MNKHAKRHVLPPWFYRVQALCIAENRDEYPYDFDEDLSELEEEDEESEQEEGEDCECDSDDSECDCHFEDDVDDVYSERSYDGSDADEYYELKIVRDMRKEEKLEERKEQDRQKVYERAKEEEVSAVYKSLVEAMKEHKIIPIEPLATRAFKLFSSEHVEHADYALVQTKEVIFSPQNEWGYDHVSGQNEQNPAGEIDMLCGIVKFDLESSCSFGPMRPPQHASQNAVKVKTYDGKHELSFVFMGNGYLKVRASAEAVFKGSYNANHQDIPPGAPEVFEFAGIVRDLEKEREERRKEQSKIPSPRESWFEMNHPMGAWKQSRW